LYLRRLELHGFKSFADRTELEFGRGLTAIVGPNGCGKSNVLDAVRWVLGEQSAKTLRGGKMADVVFAGSRDRKPAQFAEIKLTFSDCRGVLARDQDEVSVGRTLFANGDSEYRLDGNPCRLKDIRDLFLDTGVGVDAYSVIEQGRVDLLLAASPLERREIFEEAAGISRYKVRRVEAQRKLERAQNNLLRLNDVIEELERRLRSVKLAAGKARSFQEYDGRLRALRSTYSLATYHQLEQGRSALAERVARAREELEGLRAELAALEARVAEAERDYRQLEEQVQGAEAGLFAKQAEQGAVAERLEQGNRRLTDLRAAREQREAEIVQAAARAAELEQRLTAEEAAKRELAELAARAEEQVAELRRQRAAAEERVTVAERQLAEGRSATFEAARELSRLHNEEETSRGRCQQHAAALERVGGRRAQVEEARAALQGRLASLSNREGELDDEIEALRTRVQQLDQALALADQELRALGEQLHADKEARSAAASRLELLAELDRRQEGVELGTQAVLAWRDEAENGGGVVGLVADVLRIDDPRVHILQAVLSTFERYVVLRSVYGFLSELARRDRLPGPACVLALDRLSPPRMGRLLGDTPGVVACAADWVRCAPEFQVLADVLLGNTFIVDSLERALALADTAPDGCAFVTLAGETVWSDGRAAVGAGDDARGLISRKAEIRQLQITLDEIETRLEQTDRARRQCDAQRGDAQVQREEALAQLAALQKQHAELRTQRVRQEDELARLARELSVLAGEHDELRRALHAAEAAMQQLAAERTAADDAHSTREGRLTLLEEGLRAAQEELAYAAEALTAGLVEVGRAAERLAAGDAAQRSLRSQWEAARDARAVAEREAAGAADLIRRVEQELSDAERRQLVLEQECASQESEIAALRQSRHDQRQRLDACGEEAKALRQRISAGEESWHAAQVELRETEVRREELVTRVRDELGIELTSGYGDYRHEEQDWDALRGEIDELRERIARLGNVNLDALAELEELTPRHAQLVTQRSDLVESSARLERLIAELDQESRARFAATFEQIRGQFQELFRKLFGGGKADMILEDPDEPLEAGIEIIARPPGKEPQSISLLSGGEKTLTAVALLFGVFRSRPSPFAILDEVDAALDESNIERFNNVLQEFLAASQFIVITHNKRTMQRADVLYGVTMEEPGVSKRVSVRFEDSVEAPSGA